MDRDEIKQKKEFYQKNETFFDTVRNTIVGTASIILHKGGVE